MCKRQDALSKSMKKAAEVLDSAALIAYRGLDEIGLLFVRYLGLFEDFFDALVLADLGGELGQ